MVSSLVVRTSILTTRLGKLMTAVIRPPEAAPRITFPVLLNPTSPVSCDLIPEALRPPSSITQVPDRHRLLNMRPQLFEATNTKRLTRTLATLLICIPCLALSELAMATALFIPVLTTLVTCLETTVLWLASIRGSRLACECRATQLLKPQVLLAVTRATDRPLPPPLVIPDTLLQQTGVDLEMVLFPTVPVILVCCEQRPC